MQAKDRVLNGIEIFGTVGGISKKNEATANTENYR
jgi:hypothetical protein